MNDFFERAKTGLTLVLFPITAIIYAIFGEDDESFFEYWEIGW